MNDWYLLVWKPSGEVHIFSCGSGLDLLTLLGLRLPLVFLLYGVPNNWVDIPGWVVGFGTGAPDAYCRSIATMHGELPSGVL